MKPAPFALIRVTSINSALDALAQYGHDGARPIAGGQSLLPMMSLRLASPKILVDINDIEELQKWEVVDGQLRVGAAVRQRDLELDSELAREFPLLRATLKVVSHPEVRNRGTMVGSIAHADPSAELPALLLATGGHVEVRGPEGGRRIPADELIRGAYTTSLRENEVITHAITPLPGPGVGWALEEFARRKGDFAIVGVLVTMGIADGLCSSIRVVLFGVSDQAIRATAVESLLIGEHVSHDLIVEAAAVAIEESEVLGDIHGSATFRTLLCRSLVPRAIRIASGRAGYPIGESV